jgi:hypothetical protein
MHLSALALSGPLQSGLHLVQSINGFLLTFSKGFAGWRTGDPPPLISVKTAPGKPIPAVQLVK